MLLFKWNTNVEFLDKIHMCDFTLHPSLHPRLHLFNLPEVSEASEAGAA